MNSCVLRNLLIWMPNNAESVCRKVGENWANLSQIDDSDTQIKTPHYCITEAYPVLMHWWVVDSILIFCWSTACFNILLSSTQHFYIIELYPILIHGWGITYLNTLPSNSQILKHCWANPNFNAYWAIPNPNAFLRNTLSYYNAKKFSKTKILLSNNHS